jgi:hypothetical protein
MADATASSRLEASRREIQAIADRFATAAASAIREALAHSIERFVGDHATWFDGLDDATASAFRSSVESAIHRSADQIASRLRDIDLWLAPGIVMEEDEEWDESSLWEAFLGEVRRRRSKRPVRPDERLDDPGNRVWIALLNAADVLDPVLQEFGFGFDEEIGPDPGGGHFGLQPRTAEELDPDGRLRNIWREYLGAFGRYEPAEKEARQERQGEERTTARRRWRRPN